MIHDRFIKTNEEFHLFNIYASCENGGKQLLWDSLSGRLQLLGGKKVCVYGDFNVVQCEEEWRFVRQGFRSLDYSHFNLFIDDNGLVDLPLCGRKFTWYKGDGLSMGQIDRFLLSEDWCFAWPNYLQMAQLRGLSDHFPLLFSVDEENWGYHSLRMLKCWQDIPVYQ